VATQSQPGVKIGEIYRSYHRVEEGEGWSTTRLQLWVNTSVNRDPGHHPTRQQQETRDFCLKEGEEWNATPPHQQQFTRSPPGSGAGRIEIAPSTGSNSSNEISA
jgi:hypothetical protein